MLDGVAVVAGAGNETPTDPLKALPGSDAIIAGAGIQYNAALMERVPSLRVISRSGIGIDNIVLADATAHHVAILNTPDAPTISTAEHAITLMLTVTKTVKHSESMLRDGAKHDFFGELQSVELCGLRLGLVGMGRIGSRVAKVALALGMEVSVYDPYISPDRAAELGVTPVPTLDALLSAADVVSLHVPHTAETTHLINAARLAQMKPGAFLINTARGKLVDESALIKALESGHLRGAGLDVFDPEPPKPDNPLLKMVNVVATPHVASSTTAGKERLWRTAISQALQALQGERPQNLCNPEVWPLPK
jgi:D-3-phosphoglycerate dehydrogenase